MSSALPGSRRRLVRWLVRVLVFPFAAVVVAAICGLTVLVIQGKATPAGNSEYVALGSSFAAGPGITTQAAHSAVLCDRAADNYAHLVARAEKLDLTDMTCSGAVTSHVLEGGQYFQGPQVEAVKPWTKLVTITVGGNDVYYLGNLFAWSCAMQPSAVPVAFRLAGVCTAHSDAEVEAAFAKLPVKMTDIAKRVHAVAPKAQVIFVDYTTVLPEAGTCGALPISTAQAERARSVAARLEGITAAVAAQTGSTLVKASAVTKGHDICSPEPWVYGFQFGRNPFAHAVLPYHPREAAMQQIATAVEQAIRIGK